MNGKIRELEDRMIDLVNSYDLPVEVKRLVAGNIYHLLTREADKVIISEMNENKEVKSNGSKVD